MVEDQGTLEHVSTLAIVVTGIGVFLLYEAVKKSTPTPVTTAKAALSK